MGDGDWNGKGGGKGRRPSSPRFQGDAWAAYKPTNGDRSDRPDRHDRQDRFDRGRSFSRMQQITFEGQVLVPINKDFGTRGIHPDLVNYQPGRIDSFRWEHGIKATKLRELDPFEIPRPMFLFDHVPFFDKLKDTIKSIGWEQPTPIQLQTWPAAACGHDLIGISPTGSGKTGAYLIPLIAHAIAQQELKSGQQGPIALVLVPTRDLCKQVYNKIDEVLSVLKGAYHTSGQSRAISCHYTCGGEVQAREDKELSGHDVLIATPGSFLDKLYRGVFGMDRLTFVVIDEVDLLVSQGRNISFSEEVGAILNRTRPDRQLLLFSATSQDRIEAFAQQYLKDKPLKIVVGPAEITACKDVLQQFWLDPACRKRHFAWLRPERNSWLEDEGRLQAAQVAEMDLSQWRIYATIKAIKRHLKENDWNKALVFANSKEQAKQVAQQISEAKISCKPFHGDLTQAERDKLLERFNKLEVASCGQESPVSALVTTDAMARGLDLKLVGLVLNYELPSAGRFEEVLANYVHRVGRTGRGGKTGIAITLLTDPDLRLSPEFRKFLDYVRQSHPTFPEPPEWLRQAEQWKGRFWTIFNNRPQGNGKEPAREVEPVEDIPQWNGRGSDKKWKELWHRADDDPLAPLLLRAIHWDAELRRPKVGR